MPVTYATIQDMRDRGVTPEQAGDDAVTRALLRATIVVDAYCGRNFWKREQTYYLDGNGKPSLFLEDRPVLDVLELTVDEYLLDADEFVVYGEPGYIRLAEGMSIFTGYPGVFPQGTQNIAVHGWFGYEEVPPEVNEACVILALAFLRQTLTGGGVGQSQANSTEKAIGISSIRLDDLSVSFEYPSGVASETSNKKSTGLTDADRLLWRFRKDLEAVAI